MLHLVADSHSLKDGDGLPSDAWVTGIYSKMLPCSPPEFVGSLPDLESSSDSDCERNAGSLPDLESASNSDSDSDTGSLPALGSSSDTGSDDGCEYYATDDDASSDGGAGSLPNFESFSGSGDGSLPSDVWASGMHFACVVGTELVVLDVERPEVACGLRTSYPGSSPSGSKSAFLDSGATKHIFNSVEVFGNHYDASACETFAVVQSRSVDFVGSGTVTFAKLDIQSERMVGLQFLGAHCIPGQSFSLVSVVALEDAGFLVDFGATQISKGGAVFSFSRIGNQFIICEDGTDTMDTYLACAIHHGNDTKRDKSDWKFDDTEPHFNPPWTIPT
ncbi:hypothetical protein CYMTET_28483 [Cymbomonas tetramitiformis]|uniref:Uncharacterized protein n=1 Tax=Cymbomonas tetramitiformis TaxID=36881 RepID=A0AAE0FN04_9CHLO|nr:hypothetical protein CYMTET_28483 [Cymbomonas tetramitiformis]